MQDGWLRRTIKACVRTMWSLELGLRRGLAPRPRWQLTGSCNGCGACCERPTIAVGRMLWRWPTPRRLFLAWQHRVNGFVEPQRLSDARAYAFRCTHYDPQTRLCDSYSSRPWMCRDYPRVLLGQSWPELFDDCSHGLVDRQGGGLAAALEETDLDPEARAELLRKLRLRAEES